MALAASAPASALVTFGSTIALSNSNFRYVNSGSATPSQIYSTSGASAASPSPASIVFGVTNAVFGALPLAATIASLQLDAVMPSVTTIGSGAFNVTGIDGSFSILSDAPITLGGVTSQVLLTATFTNAMLSGTIGSSAIILSGGSGSGTVNYSSDFLSFAGITETAFTFAGSATQNLSTGTQGRLRSFRSTVTGSFSSDPLPSLTVPEPETWALLVLGFGLVGVTSRRRRKVILA